MVPAKFGQKPTKPDKIRWTNVAPIYHLGRHIVYDPLVSTTEVEPPPSGHWPMTYRCRTWYRSSLRVCVRGCFPPLSPTPQKWQCLSSLQLTSLWCSQSSPLWQSATKLPRTPVFSSWKFPFPTVKVSKVWAMHEGSPALSKFLSTVTLVGLLRLLF